MFGTPAAVAAARKGAGPGLPAPTIDEVTSKSMGQTNRERQGGGSGQEGGQINESMNQ